jgi:hypothetical protein
VHDGHEAIDIFRADAYVLGPQPEASEETPIHREERCCLLEAC